LELDLAIAGLISSLLFTHLSVTTDRTVMGSRDWCGLLRLSDQSPVFCTICHCGNIHTTALRLVVRQLGCDLWCDRIRFTSDCFKNYRKISCGRPRLIARPAATIGSQSQSFAWLVARPVVLLDPGKWSYDDPRLCATACDF